MITTASNVLVKRSYTIQQNYFTVCLEQVGKRKTKQALWNPDSLHHKQHCALCFTWNHFVAVLVHRVYLLHTGVTLHEDKHDFGLKFVGIQVECGRLSFMPYYFGTCNQSNSEGMKEADLSDQTRYWQILLAREETSRTFAVVPNIFRLPYLRNTVALIEKYVSINSTRGQDYLMCAYWETSLEN